MPADEPLAARPFEKLSPEIILDSVEAALGERSQGSYAALNSVENRVLELPMESGNSVVVKFYRPGRWPAAALLEEHTFLQKLESLEIPVVAPLKGSANTKLRVGDSLFKTADGEFYFVVFPKFRGRIKDEYSQEDLHVLGRLIARLHLAGARQKIKHRPALNPKTRGHASLDYLEKHRWLNSPMAQRYTQQCDELITQIETIWQNVSPEILCLHGDCHIGNLLWSEGAPAFLDFDDLTMGPAIQDLWMIVGDPSEENREDWETILASYEEFRPWPQAELRLVRPLRALRMIHFSRWIAERWSDPSFPSLWPLFGSDQWWSDEIQALAGISESLFD